MLKIKNVSKTYISKTGVSHRALDNISLYFEQTGLVFILGKSGSGKTTLMNLIAGIDNYDRGEIIIDDKSFNDFRFTDFAKYRNTIIGYIFQDYNLIDAYNAYDNIKLALALQSEKSPEKITSMLEKLEISELAKRRHYELSGGQKQRVAIARALIKEPKIILADEPSGALDEKTTLEIFNILKELSKTRLVIVVSHNKELAYQYGERIIEIKDGQVLKDFLNTAQRKVEKIESELISNRVYHFKQGNKLGEYETAQLNHIFTENRRNYYLSVEQSPQKVKALFPDIKEAFSNTKSNSEGFSQYIYKETEPTPLSLKKSNLPLIDALRLSWFNIWKKKINFIILSLISIFVITLFGLTNSVSTSSLASTYVGAIQGNKVDSYVLSNKSGSKLYSYQIDKIDSWFTRTANYYDISNVLSKNSYGDGFWIEGIVETDYFADIYKYDFIFKSESHFSDSNGVIISEYIADQLISSSNSQLFASREELYDADIYLADVLMRIVGIYRFNYTFFEDALNGIEEDPEIYNELLYQAKIHLTRIFVSSNGLSEYFAAQTLIRLYPFGNRSNAMTVFHMNALPNDIVTVNNVLENYIYLNLTAIKNLIPGFSTSNAAELITDYNNAKNSYIFDNNQLDILHASNTIKIKGYINDNDYIPRAYISDDIYQECKKEILRSNFMVVRRDKLSSSQAKKDVKFLLENKIMITNRIVTSAMSFQGAVDFFNGFLRNFNIFLVIVLIFMLYLFLSSSIKKNRRQIGILRAMGASIFDIIKIFVMEAIIIGIIGASGSVIAFNISGNMLNRNIIPKVYIPLIDLAFVNNFYMIWITILVLAIGLVLPMIRLARMRVIKLINN